jgi:hypothetical protein
LGWQWYWPIRRSLSGGHSHAIWRYQKTIWHTS